jgi:hypothetical protein
VFLPWLPVGFCDCYGDHSLSLFLSFSVPVIVCVDLVANDTTDRGPTDRSNSAASGQNGTPDAPNARADCGILVLS